MSKQISVLVLVVVGLVLGAIPLPAAEVLTPQQAGKKEPGTSIVVEMRVKSVVPYPDGYIRLFSEERFDDELNFIVVLSPAAVQRLNRQGIDDIQRHFVEKVIRAKGKLERVIMSSKPITRPGVFVSDPADIETAPALRQETKNQKPFRVYFVGNSVTDMIKYTALAEVAKSRGHNQVWGRHMIPGAPLQWIWRHPKDGFQEPPFGYYPNALANYEWDVISLQPFDRLLDAEDGDLTMAKNFIDLALQKSPDIQIYVYARWPRQGKDDFDISWMKKYTGGWDGTNETKDYFERLTMELRRSYPNLKKPILMVPVGHVMYELNQQMKAGKVPGYTHIKEVFADGIHLNNVGSYIVGCTFFATLYKENPKGLSSIPYKVDNPKLAEIIQNSVWRIVSTHELAGSTEPKAGVIINLKIAIKKSDDQIETTTDSDSVIFDIKSRSGIGGATITTKNGKWPTTIVLRLHLGGLESFNVSNGKMKLVASVLSHSGNTQRLYLTEDGKDEERESGTEIKVLDAAGKPVNGLPGKDGYFEITLPKALMESQPKTLELGWIDFFRG